MSELEVCTSAMMMGPRVLVGWGHSGDRFCFRSSEDWKGQAVGVREANQLPGTRLESTASPPAASL